MKRNAVRIIAALHLLMMPFAADAATLADKFTPETPYYFDSFDPGQQPWKLGQHLNIEEVFKNYQYYEIVLDQTARKSRSTNISVRQDRERKVSGIARWITRKK